MHHVMRLVDQHGRTLDLLRNRKRAYGQTFGSPTGQLVLADLAKFCRATESCFNPDPRLHAVAEGRREVWLRIAQHMNLPLSDLYAILGGATLPPEAFEGDEE